MNRPPFHSNDMVNINSNAVLIFQSSLGVFSHVSYCSVYQTVIKLYENVQEYSATNNESSIFEPSDIALFSFKEECNNMMK